MRRAVRPDHAVADEVGVVRGVAEVAAVGVEFAAFGVGLFDALVDPVPDETALHPPFAAEELEVVDQRTVAVAHRVGVFAHDERTGVVAGEEPFDRVERRIHRADGVGDVGVEPFGRLPRRPVVALPDMLAHRAFVVDEAGGVVAADPAGHAAEVRADAGLVAERPLEDAGVVFVADDHA
ncbi:hypothetical protein SDC9_200152 [bioreactor metagenome]|uniref:Uncharacterized protein n=1 Tax=bioreactor metagenome TaxID=1076179 RepID=A0A645IN14_9ZZZZ